MDMFTSSALPPVGIAFRINKNKKVIRLPYDNIVCGPSVNFRIGGSRKKKKKNLGGKSAFHEIMMEVLRVVV